jgi:glycosyltransferase involved in cell wall biosynthesis
MKIVHATNYLPFYHAIFGGGEQAVYRLAKLQVKKGYDVYVLSTKPVKKPKEDFKFFSVNIMEDYFSKIKSFVSAFKLVFFPVDLISFFSSYKILKKIRSDILHLHNFNILSFSILQAAKILKIPVVLSIYDYWYFCPLAMLFDKDWNVCKKYHGVHCSACLKTRSNIPEFLIKPFLFFRKVLFDHFLNKIDAFITLSNSSSRILKYYGINEEKIYTIPLSFSFKDIGFKISKKTEKNLILYVGWLVPHKGLHILIEAMPDILKKIPNAKLLVHGDDAVNKKYTSSIKEKIKMLGLEKNVLLLGKRSYDEVKADHSRASIIVIPEQWENMSPLFLIESMLSEKAIVASRIGGIPEFIKERETGLLADPKNPKDFAKKIIWILGNQKYAKKMGKAARKFALKVFDEDKTFNEIIELYKKLLCYKK